MHPLLPPLSLCNFSVPLILELAIHYDIVTVLIQLCMWMQKMLTITHFHEVSAITCTIQTIYTINFNISMFPISNNCVHVFPDDIIVIINCLRFLFHLYSRKMTQFIAFSSFLDVHRYVKHQTFHEKVNYCRQGVHSLRDNGQQSFRWHT